VRLSLVRRCLKTIAPDLKIVHLSSVDSTNDEAKRQVKSGVQEELLVLAETQTQGRGRYGRKWMSPEGGLYLSFVTRPVLVLQSTPLLGLLCACAVAEALGSIGVERVRLKWPNDIQIDEYKIAGILSEIVPVGADDYRVILGIGINQNIDTSVFPDEFRYSTTSVLEHLGHITSREKCLCEVLSSLERLLQTTRSEGSFVTVLEKWKEMSATLGAKIRVTDESWTIVGIAKDILSDGSLLVETKDGDVRVVAGDVRHLRHD
jgi:BirA family biotin operon repressor/biotin-[acetyl-CoA-carboxylase] ligase